MTDKEKIRAEVERQYEILERVYSKTKGAYIAGRMDALDYVEQFIDSLPEEPAPKGYDEAYLNECIAKASKTWKGVDVDKFMDEVRGRESDDLDKLMIEVQKYYSDNFDYVTSDQPTLSILTNIARHFTEWQKRKMMEGAVEGEVVKDISNKLAVTAKINLVGFKFGQKVKIIILKDDER